MFFELSFPINPDGNELLENISPLSPNISKTALFWNSQLSYDEIRELQGIYLCFKTFFN